MPFCDGNDFYGHLLRDEEGNTCKLYTTTWFLDRFAALVPEGSGPLTGIVTKYYKQSTGEVYIIRLRQHEDNQVSTDASTRMSKTLIQFGPFGDTNTYDKLTPRVGSGQLTTTMWSAVQAGAGGISMDWGWSYARMAPATVTIKSDGSQSVSPALIEQLHELQRPRLRLVPVFLGLHGLDEDRTDAPEGYKGDAGSSTSTTSRPARRKTSTSPSPSPVRRPARCISTSSGARRRTARWPRTPRSARSSRPTGTRATSSSSSSSNFPTR